MDMSFETKIYGDWEYHPIYGIYSRIVYKKNDDMLIMIGRQYKELKV